MLTKKVLEPVSRRKPSVRDEVERNQLVEKNRGLVGYLVKRYCLANPEAARIGYDDLFQEGIIGLLRAAELWEPERSQFTTCAMCWIRQALQRALVTQAGLIRTPEHGPHEKYRSEYFRAKQILQVQFADGTDSVDLPYEIPEPPLECDEIQELEAAIATLQPRWQKIVRYRYYEEKSLKDIGELVGLTKERVRQILEVSLQLLRQDLRRRQQRRAASLCAKKNG